MKQQKTLQTEKLGADCTIDLKKKVEKASELDKRNLSSFIRIACEEKADRVISEKDYTRFVHRNDWEGNSLYLPSDFNKLNWEFQNE